jgi:hypothetical protein
MTVDHRLLEKSLGSLCTIQAYSCLQLIEVPVGMAVAGACATYFVAQSAFHHFWVMRKSVARG